MKEKKFDKNGVLFVIREIGRGYKIPLPKLIETQGFCLFCLGANVPNQAKYPKGYWCCGAFVDDLLPPLKICKYFKADRAQIKEFAKSVRPNGNEARSAYEHMKN